MPRTSTKAKTEAGEVTTRAPRRTVTTRAPRRVATKRTVSDVEPSEETTSVRRKAPTRLVEEAPKAAPPKREKSLYVSGALFGLGLLAAALIGYSDKGQINPAVVIAERNARLTAGVGDVGEAGQATTQAIPVQNTSTEKNGGLVLSSDQPEPAVFASTTEADLASTTASTTDLVASTTDDSLVPSEEEVDNTAPQSEAAVTETETEVVAE